MYRCDCFAGYTGANCDEEVGVTQVESASKDSEDKKWFILASVATFFVLLAVIVCVGGFVFSKMKAGKSLGSSEEGRSSGYETAVHYKSSLAPTAPQNDNQQEISAYNDASRKHTGSEDQDLYTNLG